MEKQRNNRWVYILCTPIILLACVMGIFTTIALTSPNIALTPPKVSEWKNVTVVSRNELIVPCGLGSETEVTLVFSDGTVWKGYPSSAKANERHLLYAQKGDTESYRYNSHYLRGKEWR